MTADPCLQLSQASVYGQDLDPTAQHLALNDVISAMLQSLYISVQQELEM